jgi:hypothetical protein
MSMKTTSSILTVISFVFSVLYGWMLLDYIRAPLYLWVLWVVSMIMMISTLAASLWARDAFYASEFQKVLDSARRIA